MSHGLSYCSQKRVHLKNDACFSMDCRTKSYNSRYIVKAGLRFFILGNFSLRKIKMNIIEWIIWVIGVLVLLFFVPFYFHPRPLFGHLFKIFAFLIVLGLILTAFTQLSKLHLLWWIPLSFILTILIFHDELQWRFNRLSKEWTEREEKQLTK